MSTYEARVTVEDGTLHTSRPLTAPEAVRDLIEWTVGRVVDAGGELAHVALVFETAGESETPLGDSIAATSSTPLPAHADAVHDEDGVSATVGGQP